MITDYNKARDLLLTSSVKDCRQFFRQNNCALELAYCDIIEDNLEGAKKNFTSILEKDIRAKWGLILISMIEGDVSDYPTYFEIRNFLEIDIQILIAHYKGDYVESIVKYADFLFSLNPESYKFIARVFQNNDLKPQAKFFLEMAKQKFYNDPELHYMLALYYRDENLHPLAFKAAQDCLKICPGYYPAETLLKQLNYSG